jgi:hypothetical protein
MPNLSCRALFDIPDDVAYFNTAYNAPLLRASRDALVCAAGAKLRPWERAPADFFADAETLRGVSAALFGTAAENFAIVPAASYGISTAARILEPRLQAGDHILVAAPSDWVTSRTRTVPFARRRSTSLPYGPTSWLRQAINGCFAPMAFRCSTSIRVGTANVRSRKAGWREAMRRISRASPIIAPSIAPARGGTTSARPV